MPPQKGARETYSSYSSDSSLCHAVSSGHGIRTPHSRQTPVWIPNGCLLSLKEFKSRVKVVGTPAEIKCPWSAGEGGGVLEMDECRGTAIENQSGVKVPGSPSAVHWAHMPRSAYQWGMRQGASPCGMFASEGEGEGVIRRA